jgi:hypothetical protein
MPNLNSMSVTATKTARIPGSDEAFVPVHLPSRSPYRSSIPAAKLRKIVFGVIEERQAKERKTAADEDSRQSSKRTP